MARPEKHLDREAGPLASLACDLRELRRSVPGLTYRSMARKANYSPTVLSEAVAGRRLPTRDVTKAYVESCGGDWTDWSARWQDVCAELDGHAGPQQEDSGAAAEPAEEEPAAEQQAARRVQGRMLAVLAAVVAALAAAVVVLVLLVFDRPEPSEASAGREQPEGRAAPGAPPPGAACSNVTGASGCIDPARKLAWVKDLPPGDRHHTAVYWRAGDGAYRGDCHNKLGSKGPWVTCPLPAKPSAFTLQAAVVERDTILDRGDEVTAR